MNALRSTKLNQKMIMKNDDEATRNIRGTYVSIYPTLVSPTMCQIYTVNESHRFIMTKYRTGSHYLNVQRAVQLN